MRRVLLSRKLPEVHEYDTRDGGVCGSASQVRHILARGAGFLSIERRGLHGQGVQARDCPPAKTAGPPSQIPSYPRGGMACIHPLSAVWYYNSTYAMDFCFKSSRMTDVLTGS